MTNAEIKNLLFDIKNYYNDDFNYWLQVGLVEQSENNFEKALNRFNQADAISNDSYVVQNAIAEIISVLQIIQQNRQRQKHCLRKVRKEC